MTTHIYVAGPYGRRDEAEELANQLWAAGFVVTSRWHCGPANNPTVRTRETDRKFSMQNWHDIDGATVIVALIYPEACGTLVEIGGAIKSETHDVFLVGKPGSCKTLMVEHDKVQWVSREHVVSTLLQMSRFAGKQ